MSDEEGKPTVPSMAPVSLGQVAFKTYWDHRYVDPQTMHILTWEQLSNGARAAWEAAATLAQGSGYGAFVAYWASHGYEPAQGKGWDDLDAHVREAWEAVAKVGE